MAPSPSPEAGLAEPGLAEPGLTDVEVDALLDIAEDSIGRALAGHNPAVPSRHALPPSLREPIGAFVTISVAGELNGCIGAVAGDEPVGQAVARLAVAAAFDDPRLPSLRREDHPHLTIELSLLSPLTAIAAASRVQLIAALRPGHDGLMVAAGRRRGLFLPSVWEQLPEPDDFCDHLWRKAGLPARAWPDDLRAYRFTARRHHRSPSGQFEPVRRDVRRRPSRPRSRTRG